MNEYPIPFKDEMVRAILDLKKTQTRRIPSPQNKNWRVGDRLWVREAYRYYWDDELYACIQFRADMAKFKPVFGNDHASLNKAFEFSAKCEAAGKNGKRQPSMFMRREYSRILCEIISLREEPVQDITEADAKAEGVTPNEFYLGNEPILCRINFRFLWDSINAERGYGWDTNPRVKVTEFKILEVKK